MAEFVMWMGLIGSVGYAADRWFTLWRERPVCIRTSQGKWRSARRASREQERRCGGR